MAAYKSAHGWFYTYYHAGHYLKKNSGTAGITKALNETHINNLKASIERQMPTFTPQELDEIKDVLNTRINLQNNELQNLLKAAKVNKSQYANEALRAIVKKLGDIDNITAQKIVDKLYWDEAVGAFQYGGTDDFGLSKAQRSLSQWNPGAAKNYRIASFAIERINSFIKLLGNNFSKDQIESVAPLIKELKSIESFIKKQDTVTKKGDKYTGSIPLSVTYMIDDQAYEIAEAIWTYITQIKNTLSGISDINTRLAWIQSELLGNLAGAHVEAVARKELAKLILDWSKNTAGTTHAKAKGINNDLIETQLNVLNQDHLRKIYQSAEQEAKGKSKRMAETYIQKLNASMPSDSASFVLKNQVSAQGKMDAELIITLKDGKEVKAGMSLKNYNMESSGSLALQKSGFLWNYLIDAPTRNFTEHILNIYAKRDEEITGDANAIAEEQAARDAVSELIEPARKALYATLLFSALTGYNQGRTGREASLLVLYSKNQSQQKGEALQIAQVYDMASIVLDIIDNDKYDSVKVFPKMNAPIFENKYEDAENGPSQEAASLRLTKILQQARQENISVSLAKSYFNLTK